MPRDLHTGAVAYALQEKGHEPVSWYGSDFPGRQTISIDPLADSRHAVTIADRAGAIVRSKAYDAVWHRRPGPPVPPEGLHAGDSILVKKESEALIDSLWYFLADRAFWVNPRSGVERASCKALQLREAARCGFAVPKTLMSNDPAQVRDFFRACNGDVVYKLQLPAWWDTGNGGLASAFTARLSSRHLEDDAIRNCPAIFQERVRKAFELRITCMGDTFVAVKLNSQESDRGKTDWRVADAVKGLAQEPFSLPRDVERACRRLLERLGIVFACIDVVVTPDGDYVFLEVNEGGQFLWLEERVPDLRMLDIFSEFIASGDPDFVYSDQRSGKSVALSDFAEEAWIEQEREVHVEPAITGTVPD